MQIITIIPDTEILHAACAVQWSGHDTFSSSRQNPLSLQKSTAISPLPDHSANLLNLQRCRAAANTTMQVCTAPQHLQHISQDFRLQDRKHRQQVGLHRLNGACHFGTHSLMHAISSKHWMHPHPPALCRPQPSGTRPPPPLSWLQTSQGWDPAAPGYQTPAVEINAAV